MWQQDDVFFVQSLIFFFFFYRSNLSFLYCVEREMLYIFLCALSCSMWAQIVFFKHVKRWSALNRIPNRCLYLEECACRPKCVCLNARGEERTASFQDTNLPYASTLLCCTTDCCFVLIKLCVYFKTRYFVDILKIATFLLILLKIWIDHMISFNYC